jgi:hypothetical protein
MVRASLGHLDTFMRRADMMALVLAAVWVLLLI